MHQQQHCRPLYINELSKKESDEIITNFVADTSSVAPLKENVIPKFETEAPVLAFF